MVTTVSQLSALQWKNMKLRVRQWSGMIIEFGLPAYLSLTLVIGNYKMGGKPITKEAQKFPLLTIVDETDDSKESFLLTYTPASSAAEKLFTGVDHNFPDLQAMELGEAKKATKKLKEAAGMQNKEEKDDFST
ncbi:unnamed protein product, partial [Lymnaea stagnalis]